MKIAIIGAGHMGGWLAREFSDVHEVAVYDIDREKTDKLKEVIKILVLNDLTEVAVFSPQLLINAVSLQNTLSTFHAVEQYIPEDCIISDVASIKGEIPEYYKKCAFRFASVHPMFGPTFSNLEALKKENAVIIKESDPVGEKIFRELFERLGVKIFYYTAQEHDRMMAYSLTTPFVATLTFAACMTEKAVPGTTFARHREIAKGLLSEDDHLLSEILFNPDSITQLENITNKLEYLKHIIRARDYDLAKKFFDSLRGNI